MKARVRLVPIMQINDVHVANNSKNIARKIEWTCAAESWHFQALFWSFG